MCLYRDVRQLILAPCGNPRGQFLSQGYLLPLVTVSRDNTEAYKYHPGTSFRSLLIWTLRSQHLFLDPWRRLIQIEIIKQSQLLLELVNLYVSPLASQRKGQP